MNKIWYVGIHDRSTGYCQKCHSEEEARKVFDDFSYSARYTCDIVEAIEVTIHSDGHRTERKLFW